MDENTKTTVLEMRAHGDSYTKISSQLKIPVGTIKSLCHRSGADILPPALSTCKFCKKEIKQPERGKKKMFCSQTCRNQWWNSNIEKVDRRAFYKRQCVYCNRQFEVYGRPNAKFCSHACYIAGRYHNK